MVPWVEKILCSKKRNSIEKSWEEEYTSQNKRPWDQEEYLRNSLSSSKKDKNIWHKKKALRPVSWMETEVLRRDCNKVKV